MYRLGLLITLLAGLASYAGCTSLISINGHTMVSMGSFARQFGTVVQQDDSTNTYSMSLNGTTVYVIPYSTTAWINDEQTELRSAPVMVDGHLYVSLHFLLKAFNMQYTWGTDYSSIGIIYNDHSYNWSRNTTWGTRYHAWQHPADFRISVDFHSAPRQSFHGRTSRIMTTTTTHRTIRRAPVMQGRTTITGGRTTTTGGRTSTYGGRTTTTGGRTTTNGGRTTTITGGRTTTNTGGRTTTTGGRTTTSNGHTTTTGGHSTTTGGHSSTTPPAKNTNNNQKDHGQH